MEKTCKSKKVRVAIIIAIMAALAVLLALYIKGKYFDNAASVICIYDEENEQSAVYINSKLVGKVEGEAKLHNNMNNSAYFITTDAAVYLMESEQITELAKDMTLKTFANNSNEAILEDVDGVIYLCKDYELMVLSDEKVNVVAISGDGSVYSYSTDESAYYGSKPGTEKCIEGVVISHISQDAKYIYTTKHTSENEFRLSVVLENGDSKLIEEKATSIIGLNASGTELMYTSAEGSFISVDGSEGKMITEKLVYDIYYYDNKNSWCGDFWSVESLSGAICEVMETDGTTTPTLICKLSKDYVAEVIANDCYEFIGINSSMSFIFYKDGEDNLKRVETKGENKVELLAEDVELARISPDGKDVYFTRTGDENITILYHIENGLKEKQVAYVYEFFDVIVYDDYCYIEAKNIHYVKDDKVEKLEELDNLECFFIDYLSQKAYGYDKTNVYEIDGKNKKTLKGEFGSIASYDYVY